MKSYGGNVTNSTHYYPWH